MNDSVHELIVTGPSNGGKSSVISMLTEDDTLGRSPLAAGPFGCREFPLCIDGRVVIRFVETPCFQEPHKILAWCRNYAGPDSQCLSRFIHAHRNLPFFKMDCELMKRIARGGTILYVVDGSQPVVDAHRVVMEILRRMARPRMALITCKPGRTICLGAWKKVLSRYFTRMCVLNAHRGGYKRRLALLERIGSMEQGGAAIFEKVIVSLRMNWRYRRAICAGLLCELIFRTLNHCETENLGENADLESVARRVEYRYWERIDGIEQEIFEKIKCLYRHRGCRVRLPGRVAVGGGPLLRKTWHVMGLSPVGLALAGVAAGGLVGASVGLAASLDFLLAGAVAGSAVGAGAVPVWGEKLSKLKVSGLSLGDTLVTVGPNRNICCLYEVLDRALFFYAYIVNRAHGCGEIARSIRATGVKGHGTCCWPSVRFGFREKVCTFFLRTTGSRIPWRQQMEKNRLTGLLNDLLSEIF